MEVLYLVHVLGWNYFPFSLVIASLTMRTKLHCFCVLCITCALASLSLHDMGLSMIVWNFLAIFTFYCIPVLALKETRNELDCLITR